MKRRTVALFDYDNVSKRCLFSPVSRISETEVDYDVWRFQVFNSLMCAIQRMRATGCVIAIDDNSWRKRVYKPYKLDRKVKRERDRALGKPELDWEEFIENSDELLGWFKANLPWKIMKMKYCEADDVIGALALNVPDTDFVVISADSDYTQLASHKHIKVYDPLSQTYRECRDTERWVTEMSLTGQGKDNIYNVTANLDHPVGPIELKNGGTETIRKPPLGAKAAEKILDQIGLDEWLDNVGPKDVEKKNARIIKENEQRKAEDRPLKPLMNTELRKRFILNKRLIDLREIPEKLVDRIVDEYVTYKYPEPENILKFFSAMRWPTVLDNLSEIEGRLLSMY